MEAKAEFPNIDSLSREELLQRYNTLKSQIGPDPSKVEDDVSLHEMVVILGALRSRSAGPPKTNKTPASSKEPSLEDL